MRGLFVFSSLLNRHHRDPFLSLSLSDLFRGFAICDLFVKRKIKHEGTLLLIIKKKKSIQLHVRLEPKI